MAPMCRMPKPIHQEITTHDTDDSDEKNPRAHPALIARPYHPSRWPAGALNAQTWGPPNQKRARTASRIDVGLTDRGKVTRSAFPCLLSQYPFPPIHRCPRHAPSQRSPPRRDFPRHPGTFTDPASTRRCHRRGHRRRAGSYRRRPLPVPFRPGRGRAPHRFRHATQRAHRGRGGRAGRIRLLVGRCRRRRLLLRAGGLPRLHRLPDPQCAHRGHRRHSRRWGLLGSGLRRWGVRLR